MVKWNNEIVKYSLLVAGERLEINKIRPLLEYGIKVLWFGCEDDKKILEENFHDYMDDLVYANSVETFLRNMPNDHPWIQKYKESNMIFCVGQGRWEEPMIESMNRLQEILKSKGVENAWFDYWGYDVDHDWNWWQKQIVYFMAKILE